MNNRLPLFFLVTGLFWMALYIYVPYVTPYAEQMHADFRLIGLIAGAYGFVQMALRIPLGVLSDRLKRRKVFVLIGLLATAVSGVLVYFLANPVALLISRSFAGVAAAAWVTFTILGASYYRSGETIKAIGHLNAINGLGRMTALLAGGFVAERLGFSYAFLIGGAVGIAGLMLGFGVVEKKPAETAGHPSFAVFFNVARNRQLVCVSVLSILVHFITFATTFGFAPIAAVNMGASNFQLGLLGMLSTLPALLVSPFMARVVKKSGLSLTLVICFTMMGLGTLLVAVSGNLTQLFAVQILSNIGFAGLATVLMGLAIRDIAPELRATAMGFYQAVYGFGMFMGPFVMGQMSHGFGLDAAFVLTGTIGFMGAATTLVFVKRGYIQPL